VATNASISLEVLTALKPVNVSSSPAPTFTVPSPTGKIHAYPGMWFPSGSRRSRWDSIHGSSWNGLVK
jgi:hypothetical protein